MVTIYTTSFYNVRYLPTDVVPISICGKAPDNWIGLEFKKLAPKWWFFVRWKDTHDNDFYIQHYNKEVLEKLDAYEIVNELTCLAKSDKIALVCYEKPAEFCHRHLVAKWIADNTGVASEEFIPNNSIKLWDN